ncbi:FkbM family methyltransferase [Tardiphaga sp. 803_E3_N1_3]|uniref:FkbM family methyltransferase n=1 Tax=Tardiphaga sp. 803_E3_N1_3 TaxID=3240785 RepID=UPI003F275057
MLLASKYNVALASAAYTCVKFGRGLVGRGDDALVRRGGINWALDLREGIDLTIYLSGYFQRKVVQACRDHVAEGGVAIDIGANMGSQSLHLCKAVGQRGRVLAIEPTAYPMSRLRRNLQQNPGFEDIATPLQVFLVRPDDDRIPQALHSSWRVTGDRSEAHPIHRGVPQVTSGAVAMTLDSLVSEAQLTKVDLIKLDVDGAEDDILAGATRVLTEFRPKIIMEVAPYTLIDRNLPGDAPLRRLRSFGYRFENLSGQELESDLREWAKKLAVGFGVDIVALPQNGKRK